MSSQNAALDQLKKFIVDNNIVGTSAGVCIGFAAKDAIQSMVGDIIVPAALFSLRKLHIDFLKKYLPETSKNSVDLSSFIKQMVSFILIIIVSFIFVKLAFEYLLNVETTIPTSDDKKAASKHFITK
jgi:large-conductance mechanosensitive channel